MVFNVENSSRVKDVNFHISLNEFNSVKFRLNFYKVEDGLPIELLNAEDIIINIENS